jgi:hypothetical protein
MLALTAVAFELRAVGERDVVAQREHERGVVLHELPRGRDLRFELTILPDHDQLVVDEP